VSVPTGRPLVSVVTPTLGQAAFIERTIRSVREQTYPHVEHIVVDGGSTDGTIEILRRHDGDPGFRWISEPDRGMYDAVRKGFELASGQVFAYLNSDDLLLPWALETIVATFEAVPVAGLVFGDALWIEQGSGRQRVLVQPAGGSAYLRRIGSFAQPATAWRRDVHQQAGGFDPTLRYTGDLDFFLRATAITPIRRIDEILAVMRSHPGMKTIADAGPMRDENDRVRAGHATRFDRSRRGVALARARAWGMRRLLLLRLACSIDSGGAHGWREFVRGSRPQVDRGRLLLGLLPGRFAGYQVDAIRSGVDWLG